MDGFENAVFVYTISTATLDAAIERLFGIFADVIGVFNAPVLVAAAIYVALIGYALLSGTISLSSRDVVIRFAKVIGIVLLLDIFRRFGVGLFDAVWAIPDGIANYFAVELSSLLGSLDSIGFSALTEDGLVTLSGVYTAISSVFATDVAKAHNAEKWGIAAWIMSMGPFVLTLVAIYIAKFMSALLLIVSPIVFILSLTLGAVNGTNIFMSWLKAFAVTFLSVIMVYIVGVMSMVMMGRYMMALIAFNKGGDMFEGATGFDIFGANYTVIQLSPLVILGLFTIIMLSQATSIAGSILSTAAINTQQATSFGQIGALQAASRP